MQCVSRPFLLVNKMPHLQRLAANIYYNSVETKIVLKAYLFIFYFFMYLFIFIPFFVALVADGLDKCIEYEKLGCYKDSLKEQRPLPKLIENYRGTFNWTYAQESINRLVFLKRKVQFFRTPINAHLRVKLNYGFWLSC